MTQPTQQNDIAQQILAQLNQLKQRLINLEQQNDSTKYTTLTKKFNQYTKDEIANLIKNNGLYQSPDGTTLIHHLTMSPYVSLINLFLDLNKDNKQLLEMFLKQNNDGWCALNPLCVIPAKSGIAKTLLTHVEGDVLTKFFETNVVKTNMFFDLCSKDMITTGIVELILSRVQSTNTILTTLTKPILGTSCLRRICENSPTTLTYVLKICQSTTDMIDYFTQLDDENLSLLHRMCFEHDSENLIELISQSPNKILDKFTAVEFNGFTPLNEICENNMSDVLLAILSKTKESVLSYFTKCPRDDTTPLNILIKNNMITVLKTIFERETKESLIKHCMKKVV